MSSAFNPIKTLRRWVLAFRPLDEHRPRQVRRLVGRLLVHLPLSAAPFSPPKFKRLGNRKETKTISYHSVVALYPIVRPCNNHQRNEPFWLALLDLSLDHTACDWRDRRNTILQMAGKGLGHKCATGKAGKVNSGCVDDALSDELIENRIQETNVVNLAVAIREFHRPIVRICPSTGQSHWVQNRKPFLVGQDIHRPKLT